MISNILIVLKNDLLLISAESGIPVILDRIDGAKAQVTERLNPILKKKHLLKNRHFLFLRKVKLLN
jgi:hypothetical protein